MLCTVPREAYPHRVMDRTVHVHVCEQRPVNNLKTFNRGHPERGGVPEVSHSRSNYRPSSQEQQRVQRLDVECVTRVTQSHVQRLVNFRGQRPETGRETAD